MRALHSIWQSRVGKSAIVLAASLGLLTTVILPLFRDLKEHDKLKEQINRGHQALVSELSEALTAFASTENHADATTKWQHVNKLVNGTFFRPNAVFLDRFEQLKAWYTELQALEDRLQQQSWITRRAHWPVQMEIRGSRGSTSRSWGLQTAWIDSRSPDHSDVRFKKALESNDFALRGQLTALETPLWFRFLILGALVLLGIARLMMDADSASD